MDYPNSGENWHWDSCASCVVTGSCIEFFSVTDGDGVYKVIGTQG